VNSFTLPPTGFTPVEQGFVNYKVSQSSNPRSTGMKPVGDVLCSPLTEQISTQSVIAKTKPFE